MFNRLQQSITMEFPDPEETAQVKSFSLYVALSQGLGVIMVVMAGLWTSSLYLGGFAWDGSAKHFNFHPLFMVIGVVFIYGEAAIVYRVFQNTEKFKLKIIHASLHIMVFVSIIIALVAVFDFHNNKGIPNMYSLHSWCGMATVLMFCLQLCLGFSAYLWPGTTQSLRATYLTLHQFFGSAILICICITCISGINEKLFFLKKYGTLGPVYAFGNVLGLVIIAFIVSIMWILHKREWRRVPLPNETEDVFNVNRIRYGDDDTLNP